MKKILRELYLMSYIIPCAFLCSSFASSLKAVVFGQSSVEIDIPNVSALLIKGCTIALILSFVSLLVLNIIMSAMLYAYKTAERSNKHTIIRSLIGVALVLIAQEFSHNFGPLVFTITPSHYFPWDFSLQIMLDTIIVFMCLIITIYRGVGYASRTFRQKRLNNAKAPD